MKHRLTLALCTNASDDSKVRPLLVYYLENPRAFKTTSRYVEVEAKGMDHLAALHRVD